MTVDSMQYATFLLESLADELDISPSKYQDAKERYDAVGRWVGDGERLKPRKPQIFPQGSFALGTAIRPIGDCDYDVDSVCRVMGDPHELSQQELKGLVGTRLKENANYLRMLDPKEGGRRCWTLRYADGSRFHLDMLPAIPDPNWNQLVQLGVPEPIARHALLITDKTRWHDPADWCHTNPYGYAEWFKERMRVRFEEELRKVAAFKRVDVSEIKDFEVRTPLQRLVQLLKRHRDVRFDNDPDRPISVIITTLAAKAYENEAEVADAILNVVPRMRELVQTRNGVYWVPNPVNPAENFADRWEKEPRKPVLFLEWLDAVERDHRNLLSGSGRRKMETYLAEAYGEHESAMALKRAGISSRTRLSKDGYGISEGRGRFDVSHRERPTWPTASTILPVGISARYTRNGTKRSFVSDSTPLPKHSSLLFQASVPVEGPYDVFWQVVNTGREAEQANGLRGHILRSKAAGVGGRNEREESTLYTGSHWVQCYIVKGGVLVAKSAEFVVNIE